MNRQQQFHNKKIRFYIFSDYIPAHDQYRQMLLEYETASIAYKANPSHDNWLMLQETIRELKRQEKVIEGNRNMLYHRVEGSQSQW